MTLAGISLSERVAELTARHGSLRAAGNAVGIDHAYLYRLATGEKKAPTNSALAKLGLLRIVAYVPRELLP
jgi:hypothetical protein